MYYYLLYLYQNSKYYVKGWAENKTLALTYNIESKVKNTFLKQSR